MKKLLILLSLLFISCAHDDFRFIKRHNKINKEFSGYIDDFIEASNGKVKESDLMRLTMNFIDMGDSSTVGTCWPHISEIDINRRWWNNNKSNLQRQALIFHELGHCLLYRGHIDPSFNSGFFGEVERLLFDIGFFKLKKSLYDGCPASIMDSYILNEYCLNNHYDYYINELFNEVSYSDFEKRASKACYAPIIINRTSEWNKLDKWTYKRAVNTCIKRYKSCLKTFLKIKTNTYSAICSG